MIEVLKPWTLKKDLRQISPFKTTSESYCKVKNIEGLIINSSSSWLLNKFSLSAS